MLSHFSWTCWTEQLQSLLHNDWFWKLLQEKVCKPSLALNSPCLSSYIYILFAEVKSCKPHFKVLILLSCFHTVLIALMSRYEPLTWFQLKYYWNENFRIWDFCLIIKFEPYLEILPSFFAYGKRIIYKKDHTCICKLVEILEINLRKECKLVTF